MAQDETEFPLHDLDYISLNEVYKNLTLVDIFELSFTNSLVRGTLNKASVPIQSISIRFESGTPLIHLKSGQHEFIWSFGYPEKAEYIGEGHYAIRAFKFQCKRTASGYHTEHYDVEHAMLAVIRYLVAIFNCSESIISELFIDVGVIEDSRSVCEHFMKFKTVERLAFHQSVDNDRNKLNLAQNFNWILENLKIHELYCGVDLFEQKMVRTPEGEFEIRRLPLRLDKALRLNHFCLKHATWFTSKDLMELYADTAIIGGNELTAEDLNTFLKNWLNSTSNKLCWLEIQFDAEDEERKAKITEGLELTLSSYKLINEKCSCPYRRFESSKRVPFEFPADTKQITRADGEIGTIAMTSDTFFFHVKNTGPITPPKVPDGVRPPDSVRIVQERMHLVNAERLHHELMYRQFEMDNLQRILNKEQTKSQTEEDDRLRKRHKDLVRHLDKELGKLEKNEVGRRERVEREGQVVEAAMNVAGVIAMNNIH
ncbi:Protein CBG09858 [Caenorhabditis briggsae]|uniref:Sdz-33 F-box domain-containing protein n=3 Tax=Caenorhabditis briggsae TaxID=6238 RepID=A0AAE9IRL5_CAEBR|nr:Protein CBG09858 [Caenorhabditis briggsae]ULU01630.1 hypothetical protein L3Y34_001740 [Caenorhabditis briggsae]UMM24278.1 hypothetical protein L5515_004585 [Caenorhabditis briggsae]CAP29405.1 Protein CBG09858 [Caenorhabditis briggsae]